MADTYVIPGLVVILLLVLILPFAFKAIEHQLEIFLFIMGVSAALVSGIMDQHLIMKALEEPIMITAAVLIAGILFKLFQTKLQAGIRAILRVVPFPVFVFLVVTVLGLVSSVITAIIASLVLVEVVGALRLDRKTEVNLVILACFSIGLGAALTPLGEPLATIAVSKMGGDFWYLLRTIGVYVVPTVVALGLLGALFLKGGRPEAAAQAEGPGLIEQEDGESFKDVIVRALKIYLFVMALTFLGDGFKPLIDRYVLGLPSAALYWINMLSAVLDNATLTAAELSPAMAPAQVKAVLMGLLISGGMLIPGNIPNIVSASKLKIGSREWARTGVPLGLALMVIFFFIVVL
ncbi:DUF1646 family protein [Symbiobacterium thermophilum]|uniref:Putative cation transporter n=2 Tax=Symbiobacterium thermophilum TaxID=2734 RepID=Q67SU8_SYMTH|nr:DUF1646 family protein [Symbiobacterium thermophilum]BAD39245.1 putative cation transporter [Symbiobacterium thermophilum IAM 14863]